MNSSRLEKWLVAVGAGRWQLSGILAARRAGILVLALDGNTHAVGLKKANKKIVADIRDIDEVVTAVGKTGLPIGGAISFANEAGMQAVGALRDHFSLPGPGLDVMTALTNKALQRKAWDASGLPNPRYWRVVKTVAEGLQAIHEAPGPVIVKPIDSAGSRGVTRLESNVEKIVSIRALKKALLGSLTSYAIIESVLPGKEYTVETFADGQQTHVLAITEKHKVPGTNNTVANELFTPDVPSNFLEPIAELGRSALEALGYHAGPGHVELMYDGHSKPAVIEAAGRGAGFMVFDRIVPLVSGYDIVTASAQQALGLPTQPVLLIPKAGVIRFFASHWGQIIKISGFQEANALEGVEAASFVKIGDKAKQADSDGDRLGYLLASDITSSRARALANRAEQHIKFEIRSQNQGQETTPPRTDKVVKPSLVNREVLVALTFDLDPDYFDPSMGNEYNSNTLDWRGIKHGVPAIAEVLSGLQDSFGGRACATWLARADNQINDICGDYGAILERFGDILRELKGSGDEIGWHPHLHRNTEGGWLQETDPDHIRNIMATAHHALKQHGWHPTATRIGGNYRSTALMAILQHCGIEVDSSAMPGRQRKDHHYDFDSSSTPHTP